MARPDRFSLGAALTGLLSIAISVLFVLEAAGSIEVKHDILWPASIVALGVAMVAEALMRQAGRDERSQRTSEARLTAAPPRRGPLVAP